MYKQTRGSFGGVSTRVTSPFLPENYSGNAFRRETVSAIGPSGADVADLPLSPSAAPALLPLPIPQRETEERSILSALGNVFSGDTALLLLVLLVLATGGGKRDDGALIMILLLLCL